MGKLMGLNNIIAEMAVKTSEESLLGIIVFSERGYLARIEQFQYSGEHGFPANYDEKEVHITPGEGPHQKAKQLLPKRAGVFAWFQSRFK